MRKMTTTVQFSVVTLAGFTVALFVSLVFSTESFGQLGKKAKKDSKPTASPAELQKLKIRVRQTQQDFIEETAQLAVDFEQAGLLEESRKLLQALQRLDGEIPGVKEKLKALGETIMTENPRELSLDVSQGWNTPVARVIKGKPVRIQAIGKYRFQVSATVLGPEGFPGNDFRGLAKNVRVGALTALIVPIDAKGKAGKPDDPVEIGAGREITPQASGLLFLAVNAPPGHRSTGKLDVLLSGYVQSPR
ncbi:MAG: hypothetical protein VB858_15820 [Planctomycetaceae bacterium]